MKASLYHNTNAPMNLVFHITSSHSFSAGWLWWKCSSHPSTETLAIHPSFTYYLLRVCSKHMFMSITSIYLCVVVLYYDTTFVSHQVYAYNATLLWASPLLIIGGMCISLNLCLFCYEIGEFPFFLLMILFTNSNLIFCSLRIQIHRVSMNSIMWERTNRISYYWICSQLKSPIQYLNAYIFIFLYAKSIFSTKSLVYVKIVKKCGVKCSPTYDVLVA